MNKNVFVESGRNGDTSNEIFELLTVMDVAVRLRLKPSWVYRHADDLGAFRLGKYLRFSWVRVLECLEEGGASLSEVASRSAGERVVKPPTQRPPLTPINNNTSGDHGTT